MTNQDPTLQLSFAMIDNWSTSAIKACHACLFINCASTYLLKAGRAPYVQYLLLESGGGPSQAPDPQEDSVLGMPGKLGVAHQDHVSHLL